MAIGVYFRTEKHLTQIRNIQKKMAESRKGTKFSKKWCENLRNALKGKITWIKGKKHSEETKKKMSLSAKGKHIGKNNGNWKGGIKDSDYYLKNKTKINLYNKKWAKKHKELVSFYAKERYRKNKGAFGFHTIKEWELLKIYYKYMCLCCKKTEPEIKLEEDHIIPLTKGGSNFIDNIQPLCHSCNSRKNTKTINYLEGDIKQYASISN